MFRNGARFFDPRFNIPRMFFSFCILISNVKLTENFICVVASDSAAAAAAAAFFLQTAFRKPKRIRTAFTPSQLLKLEHAFESNHYVVGQERKELAKSLSLTETQVNNFLNVVLSK